MDALFRDDTWLLGFSPWVPIDFQTFDFSVTEYIQRKHVPGTRGNIFVRRYQCTPGTFLGETNSSTLLFVVIWPFWVGLGCGLWVGL